MNKFIRYTLLLLLALPAPAMLQGQNPQWDSPRLPSTATGHIYLITFPEPLENGFDVRFPNHQPEQLSLYIYSDAATPVWISNAGGNWSTTEILPGQTSVEVSLPLEEFSFAGREEMPTQNVFRVFSVRPILVNCYMTTHFATEAWTPLPVEAWGKEYYAAASPAETVRDFVPAGENSFSSAIHGAPSQITVTAAFNNTEVTIVPNADLNTGSAGVPMSVNLDAGEAYTFISEVDTGSAFGPNLAGSRITSNRLIGVISGNTRAAVIDDSIGLLKNSYKNLTVEALAPVEQHGTEFVFMPTWGPGRMGLDAKSLQAEFAGIYGTSQGQTNGLVTDSSGSFNPFSVMNASLYNKEFNQAEARLFRTDQPAQGIITSAGALAFNGTTGSGNLIGATFSSWGSYTVEMTPREQWTNGAAFTAPQLLSGTQHYLNLVTKKIDRYNVRYIIEGSPATTFPFNQAIPGTDLVWGTLAINPGLTYKVYGDNGATFAGTVYGMQRGYELYRPGAPMREKGLSTSAEHPSEYEEICAEAYGFPLAPQRRRLGQPSIFEILDEQGGKDEEGETYRIRISNGTPADGAAEEIGLRSISLHPESVNAELEFVEPKDPIDLIGAYEAVVRVYPSDPDQDASALLLVTDRTGAEETAEFEHAGKASSVSDARGNGYRFETVEPNPVSSAGRITFSLGNGGMTRVEITNALGQSVAIPGNGEMTAGRHTLHWNASDLPAGIYFCTISSNGWKQTKRIVVR